MVRLIAIVALIALAYLLVRYQTRENIQKGIIAVLCGAFAIYLITVVVIELMR
ncbi:hypothetical protein [Vibrio mangrovi]|uniref:Uncharacterized protein n=1 Tax=Vibrio mangrovi TaxID=474394 RepID=A0A1Y6IN98_9VIBR|nr:hypothetical protein [Vibrio mangrovi]MDW6004068.1 hypothetical protein [Vibrio mangrovi]SMR99134.1 hypothetical protein VIM7927_00357 [Vibrio mangrovi]